MTVSGSNQDNHDQAELAKGRLTKKTENVGIFPKSGNPLVDCPTQLIYIWIFITNTKRNTAGLSARTPSPLYMNPMFVKKKNTENQYTIDALG